MSDLTDDRIAELVLRTSDGGMPDTHRALIDLQRHRAMVKRLKAWAVELELTGSVGPFIAAELRNRMRSP